MSQVRVHNFAISLDGFGTDDEWRGWWGPNPPFHTPVFVLTHHPRPSIEIEMEGGTIFHFVDAEPQEALVLAREAAGDLDVRIGGGVASFATSSPPIEARGWRQLFEGGKAKKR